MKKLLLTSTLSILSLCSFLFLSAKYSNKNFTPGATFDKLWIDYDVFDNGIKGMKIHVKFTAYEMKDMDAFLAIYFQTDDENSTWLMDKNSKYNSSDGYVAVYRSIKPQYDPAVYNDLDVFMPYSELDLDPGEYDLAMDVKIIYKAGGTVSKLTKYYFEYTKPGSTTTTPAGGTPGNKIAATFKDLWIDYDVYDNSQKGMKIHAKFSVSSMKNIEGYLACYFEKKDGTRLTSTSSAYRSKTGQLAVYKLIVPAYDQADYDDVSVFIPYSAFDLSGRNDLKIDADLIYKDGGMIQHMKYHEFWINK
jgi:hypothetical protein